MRTTTAEPSGIAGAAVEAVIRYGPDMVFDFRHKNIEGKWKSSGHRKGDTRDAAFAALEAKVGPLPPGQYMSRPRDGRTKNWDLFTRP